MNWLESNNVILNFGSKQLSIDPRRNVITDKEIVVPPNSEIAVIARIKGYPLLPNGVIGITPFLSVSL